MRLYFVFLSVHLSESDFVCAHESIKLVHNYFSHPQFLYFIDTIFLLACLDYFFDTRFVVCVFFAFLGVSLTHFVRWFSYLLLHVFLDLPSLTLLPRIVGRALFLFARAR